VVCAAGVVAAILNGGAPTAYAWIAGVLFAALIALGVGYQSRSRIALTPHEITVRGLVRSRNHPRSSAVGAVRATIVRARAGSVDTFFVLDARRNVLVRMGTNSYTRADIDRLVSALGVPCSSPGRPVSLDEFAKDYPDLVPWAGRHPNQLAFAIVGVLCAVVLILVCVSILTAS
jgi:hypothetical protein